jgi:hypothetical protein
VIIDTTKPPLCAGKEARAAVRETKADGMGDGPAGRFFAEVGLMVQSRFQFFGEEMLAFERFNSR